jgi:hypothetical protein
MRERNVGMHKRRTREKTLRSTDKRGSDQKAIAPRLKGVPGLQDVFYGIAGLVAPAMTDTVEMEKAKDGSCGLCRR